MLDARDRPGGRVLTLRDTFAGGQYAEAGAETFGETHNFVQRYVQAFHLETLPAFNYGRLTSLMLHNGQRSPSNSDLSRKYIVPAVKEIGDPRRPVGRQRICSGSSTASRWWNCSSAAELPARRLRGSR